MPAKSDKGGGRGGREGGGSGRSRAPAAPTRGEDRDFLKKYGEKLSRTTQRAKWIGSPGEQPDRPGQTLATRSREVIQAWAEARGGEPVTNRIDENGRARTLRFRFRGGDQDGRSSRLQAISWDDWFRTFEERELVMIFQEKRRDGRESNFFRLDNPHREEG